ncbi:type IIL restriction-modification enzyme MmeI [Pseudorhodoferax sp. Leaf267]|uniref:type IIL restriction-modification enzyme MmeI n=1 Tax=Pseudorhodoferax sp. Leaf267 TaxID=1736316 RepID=UPI000A868128
MAAEEHRRRRRSPPAQALRALHRQAKPHERRRNRTSHLRLALQPFDAAEFPYAFLAGFGNKDIALKRLRSGHNNASDVAGGAVLQGVLQRNHIHIAVSAAGQVGEALQALRASPATAKAKAKFILATDGQTLEAEELTSGETIACDYADFPNHFGFLLPLAGTSTIQEIKDNPSTCAPPAG